jgi:hypothetical protein
LIRSQARSGGVVLVSALLVAGCTHAGSSTRGSSDEPSVLQASFRPINGRILSPVDRPSVRGPIVASTDGLFRAARGGPGALLIITFGSGYGACAPTPTTIAVISPTLVKLTVRPIGDMFCSGAPAFATTGVTAPEISERSTVTVEIGHGTLTLP